MDKKRLKVTLPEPFIKALDHLVKERLYTDPQDATRAALRNLFRFHGIPLTPEEASGW